MDKLYQYSLEKIWLKVGIETVTKYDINTKYSHLDSSSISVHGKYNSEQDDQQPEEEKKENPIRITYGYSRDHRPDLKQFMVDLIVSSDGDVPLLMRIGSGNESDKSVFAEIIKKYQENINWETIYVADSALYTAKNLHRLGKIKWLTRVPLSIKKAKDILESAKESEFQASEHQGYRYQEKQVTYHGIKQRWLIVESEARKESDLNKLEQKLVKEREKIENQLEKWQNRNTNNLPELKVEVKQFNQKLKYHQIESIKYLKNFNKKKEEVYSCQGEIVEKSEVIQGETKRAGRFILATNVLETEELPAEKMLDEYKAQQSCERGFRFFKDPLFLADSVFVKNPQRVETMAMLMGLCLFVYSLGQRRLRGELQTRGEQVKNQLGKLTDKPTLRWIFQVLQGIHWIVIEGEKQISNLTPEIRNILKYFSVYCQNYYLIN